MMMAYAKHQRGAMCRWALQHRVMDPEKIKDYDGDGYRFAPGLSSTEQWVFLR